MLSLSDFLKELGCLARDALWRIVKDDPEISRLLPAQIDVAPTSRPDHGDYQISACLQLAKTLGKKSRDLADVVAGALGGHPALVKVEVAGAGFVNLHLDDAFLAHEAAARLADPDIGIRKIRHRYRTVIDYSSPNAAKPMHVGHIRSTIIGDAVKRVLLAFGHDVVAVNHVGDWGTQFGKLIVAYRRWVDVTAYESDPVAELLRLYVRFQQEEKYERVDLARDDEEGPNKERVPPIVDDARRELAKLQAGDAENRALWRRFVDDSRHAFQSIYDRLGVRFDHWLGESTYNDLLPGIVQELRRRGISRPSEGAEVAFFDEHGSVLEADRSPLPPPGSPAADGAPVAAMPPCIVVKRDGAFNYATTDIAAMVVRTGLVSPLRVIVVADKRQDLHFRQVGAITRALGNQTPFEHISFGIMRMPSGVVMKTRDGDVIHLTDLLDEAERRAADLAREIAAKRGGEPLSDDECRRIGRVVGLGALKYNDLSRDRETDVVFSWDKALSLEGNTAPYLQYAYARCHSILYQAAVRNGPCPTEYTEHCKIVLGTAVERALVMKLLAYPRALEGVVLTLKPHHLCDYLYEVATSFSTFYDGHSVLRAETPELRASRLALTDLTARTLRHGLELLGIKVLASM